MRHSNLLFHTQDNVSNSRLQDSLYLHSTVSVIVRHRAKLSFKHIDVNSLCNVFVHSFIETDPNRVYKDIYIYTYLQIIKVTLIINI